MKYENVSEPLTLTGKPPLNMVFVFYTEHGVNICGF